MNWFLMPQQDVVVPKKEAVRRRYKITTADNDCTL